MIRVSLGTLAFAMVLVSVGAWAADDPVIGTWKLNLAKSKYTPGPPPITQINKYEPARDGVKYSQIVIDAQGNYSHVEYTAKYDGKYYPSSGDPARDMVAWKTRSDPYTSEGSIMKGGKVISTLRRVVSKDGKTMTITVQGVDPRGRPESSIHFFDKIVGSTASGSQ